MAIKGFDDETQVRLYTTHRPQPPDGLIRRIIRLLPSNKKFGVDVGCGSGQLTAKIAMHFDKFVGIDASEAQIEAAKSIYGQERDYLEFKVGLETMEGVENNAVDLIAVSSAIHWFDVDAFHEAAAAKLKSGGVLAIVGYAKPYHDDVELNAELQKLWSAIIKHAHPLTKHVFAEYATLALPPRDAFKDVIEIKPRDKHVTIFDGSLMDVIKFTKTLDTYNRVVQDVGKAEAEGILAAFESRVKEILNCDENKSNEEIPFRMQLDWFGRIAKRV